MRSAVRSCRWYGERSGPTCHRSARRRSCVDSSAHHRTTGGCGLSDARCDRARPDRAGAGRSYCAAADSVRHTSGTEQLDASVRQPGPDCRRARRLSGRCTTRQTLRQTARPSTPTSMATLARSATDRKRLDITSSKARESPYRLVKSTGMPLAVPTKRGLWRAAVIWRIAVVRRAPGTARAKTVLRRIRVG